MFLGGFLIKKFKLHVTEMAKFACITFIVAYLLNLLYFICSCEVLQVAGLTVPYSGFVSLWVCDGCVCPGCFLHRAERGVCICSFALTNPSGFVFLSGLQTFYSVKHFNLNLDEFWNVSSLLIYCSFAISFFMPKNVSWFKDKFLLKLTCIRSPASVNQCGYS